MIAYFVSFRDILNLLWLALSGATVPTPADFSDVSNSSTIVLRATIGGPLTDNKGCNNIRARMGSNSSNEYSDRGSIYGCSSGAPIAASYVQLVVSFQPHAAVLFVRHPEHNYALLQQRIHLANQGVFGNKAYHYRSSRSSNSVSSSSSSSSTSNTQNSKSNSTSGLTGARSQVDGSMRLLERLYGRRKAFFNATVGFMTLE